MSFPLSRLALSSRAVVASLPVKRAALTSIRYNSSAPKAPNAADASQHKKLTPTPVQDNPDLEEGFPESQLNAAVISGAPADLQSRTVRIYKAAKPATQSSNWNGRSWKMDWDIVTKGGNWENPLMGWTSSADKMQGTSMFFKSKEDAIRFAENQGYDYYVSEPNMRHFRPKAYASNFLHAPGKLKMIRTK
ncbi:ETC complex I subunit conserved region-domain-containing protein [Peziza echinospora]|nr:ETC complex I subunit conserved region-domain-containing protein [Peziza echinospora]